MPCRAQGLYASVSYHIMEGERLYQQAVRCLGLRKIMGRIHSSRTILKLSCRGRVYAAQKFNGF